MAFSTVQLNRMADIVNLAIKETEFSQYVVTSTDFNRDDNFAEGLIKWSNSNNNPITKAFNDTALNRINDKGQFFHFKSFSLARQIIADKSIQISNLLSNEKNDFAEYSEFHKRLGLFHQLIPNDYCEQLKNQKYNPASISPMDIQRENILILCFSKEGHKERFWTGYANNDTGVCLSFRFLNYDIQQILNYDFRDICYDNGYRFDFINHINYHFRKEFNRQIFIEGITKFSKFYKRGKYEWENETRLCFNYDFSTPISLGHFLNPIFPIQQEQTTGRKYINLPLKGNSTANPFFTLTIDEVICGKNISDTDYGILQTELAKNFPDARIWQRK
jgi:hypothetical protein